MDYLYLLSIGTNLQTKIEKLFVCKYKIIENNKKEVFMKLYRILSCFLILFLICNSLKISEKKVSAFETIAVENNFTKKLITREETNKKNIQKAQGNAKKSDILVKTMENVSSAYGKNKAIWLNKNGEIICVPKRKEIPSFSLFSEKKQNLPDTFDLREEETQGLSRVPLVQNQRSYGLCWSIAGLEAIESSVVSSGLSYRDCWLTDGKLRFSVSHMGWHLFENPPESDGIYGDYLERAYKGADGGDSTAIIAALSSGYGLQLEKNAPYENWNYGQSENGRYISYYQLRNANYLDSASTQEARETVKQWIVSRGAVEAGFYFSEQKKESCYYQEQYDISYGNHEVILIGWDDHYAKENFKENGAMPRYDGAWLAQNSYGTDWGEQGYFYISYEEPSLFGFISYEMEEREDGEKCYQYDGAGGWIGVSSASLSSAANIFTATESGLLTNVGISLSELNSSGANYQIQIYKWKEKQPKVSMAGMVNAGQLKKEKKPDFSEDAHILEADTEGTMEYPGYHKIALKNSVELKEGECFAVVLKLLPRDQHSSVYYSFEGSMEGYDTSAIHYGFKKGQTYYQKGFKDQAEWKDVTSIKKAKEGFELGNLNVKAFTYPLSEEDTIEKEQIAQLEETIQVAEEFLNSLDLENMENKKQKETIIKGTKKFAFTKGNDIYNKELVSLLKDLCDFAKQTLILEDKKIYEIENAYHSLICAMDYMAYPAKKVITKPKQLYQLSKQTSKLTINALSLVSIEKNLIMNPDSAFQFDRFDTEQDKNDQGVIVKIKSKKTKTFYPIGGSGGVEFQLDGNGHSISGLICSTKASTEEEGNTGAYVGLIGLLAEEGTIKNLTIKNSYIEGNYCVGAFAGALAYGGAIKNCTMKNTYVYGYEEWFDNFYTTVASHIGGFSGLVSSYSDKRRSGIYNSSIKECLIYGELVTGGIVGAVNSNASAGTGNTIWNSSVVGIATYGKNRTGVGLYLGGETGNEKDAKNQAEINRHYIFHNSSSAEKDYILVNIYKPKHFTGEKQMLLFIQPYNKISRTLKSVFLQGIAKKKKRGKSYIEDGWRIKGMSGDITITPMIKELYQVSFYSSLTGESLSNQSIMQGKKAKYVNAPKIKGYRFLGWYDLSGKKFQFGTKIKTNYQLYTKYEKSKKNKKS